MLRLRKNGAKKWNKKMLIEMTTEPAVTVILQEVLQQDDVGLAAFLALAQQYMGQRAG